MAGMYDPFADPQFPHYIPAHKRTWMALATKIIAEFDAEDLRIQGLMGISFPGWTEYWVDYDEGLLYD